MFEVIPWNGEPISEPGLYSGIPLDDYHKQLTITTSISSGGLRKIFSKSPAHYFDTSYLNPDPAEQDDTEALILGRAAHHLLLGEAKFGHQFCIRPDDLNGKPWHGNRTDCREWVAARKAENLTVLKGEQVEKIRGMSRSLAAHPLIRAGALNGLIEHSLIWLDEETGIWLKARPDAIPTDSADYGDLKSATDVTDEGINRAIFEHGYNMQGGLIGMGSREVLGLQMENFSLIFAESKRPHCTRVKTLKPADLELGERQIRAALRQFADCLDRGVWPGPGGEQSDADYAEIPEWGRKRIEAQLALMEAGSL